MLIDPQITPKPNGRVRHIVRSAHKVIIPPEALHQVPNELGKQSLPAIRDLVFPPPYQGTYVHILLRTCRLSEIAAPPTWLFHNMLASVVLRKTRNKVTSEPVSMTSSMQRPAPESLPSLFPKRSRLTESWYMATGRTSTH